MREGDGERRWPSVAEEKDSTIWDQGDPVRLGTLVPSVNTIVEPDMYRMAPPHVTVHFSRLAVPTDQVTLENLERLTDRMEESLHSLAQARGYSPGTIRRWFFHGSTLFLSPLGVEG